MIAKLPPKLWLTVTSILMNEAFERDRNVN